MKKCRMCDKSISGRSDKIYCSTPCKNSYHIKLRQVTKDKAAYINTILLRNRSILLEIMGKNGVQKKVSRLILERKNFHFKYLTHFHVNSKGKMYHHVYDFAWMSFSDDEILIVKR